MFYVLKMILQTPNKAITALEIQEALMKQDMKIDIKTVYSCIKQINDFFNGWIGRDLIISYHKLGYRIDFPVILKNTLKPLALICKTIYTIEHTFLIFHGFLVS